jgi:L-lactate dehydrogenase complex protein LldE
LDRHLSRIGTVSGIAPRCSRLGSVKISLFLSCYNDTLFPEALKATVRLLERLGHEVAVPLAQTCCGQMHFNTGYQRECMPLLDNFLAAFADAETIVSPAASCVAMVREYYPYLAEQHGDERQRREVADLNGRLFELSDFLVNRLGVEDVGAYYPHRVTFHPTCHSLRMLRVGDAPLRLLRRVRGLELIELPDAEECCGFGGTFSIKNADTSVAMLSSKVHNVLTTGAESCVAADTSCLMHIGGGLHRLRTGVTTLHLAEILANTEGGT